jgi:hypothetical protein
MINLPLLDGHCPSKRNLFAEFIVSGANFRLTFTEWFENIWLSNLEFYAAHDFKLLALASHSKRPIQGFNWKDHYILPEEALPYIQKGLNLGIIAGPSNVVILDIDKEDLGDLNFATSLTLTSRTPNGYQIFTQGPYNERIAKTVQKRYPILETIRRGEMYGVAPVSETCKRNHAKGCPLVCALEGHEYKVRVWLPVTLKVMSFKELAEALQ